MERFTHGLRLIRQGLPACPACGNILEDGEQVDRGVRKGVSELCEAFHPPVKEVNSRIIRTLAVDQSDHDRHRKSLGVLDHILIYRSLSLYLRECES